MVIFMFFLWGGEGGYTKKLIDDNWFLGLVIDFYVL